MEERGIVIRNDKGYPLLPDGSIDWELTSKEKDEERDKYERFESRKTRSKITNLTPKKKKRKK